MTEWEKEKIRFICNEICQEGCPLKNRTLKNCEHLDAILEDYKQEIKQAVYDFSNEIGYSARLHECTQTILTEQRGIE